MKKGVLLEIRDLHITLDFDGDDIPIVQGIDLELPAGKVLALVGESGCGKSITSQALLRLLPREVRISSGEINFRPTEDQSPIDIAPLNKDGKEIRSIRGNQMSMIFQEPMSSFSPIHKIGDQIGEVIQLHLKVTKAEARRRVIDLLDKVGIPDPEQAVDQYPHSFSGGMRQRAMIAKSLACNPSILIADEPTTALDVTIQAQILEIMRNLKDELRMSMIFITHDLGVVAQIADEVAIMYMGRIVEKGPVSEIFNNPQHPYTVSLLSAIPRLGDLSDRRKLTSIRGSVPSLFERPPGCAFHPRCDSFIPGRCDTQFPPTSQLSPIHEVHCFIHENTEKEISS
ncbi:MAG: ABC transporter ATP-binding protein [Rhodospirillaceae bacterium]|nr:ABC transporter ATP-binding protein [Rhodospirillaceae bacterium]MBL6933490.1 ABC transporter ATP-binding protein [Rhodospirillales bacterium]